ncbi:MAG: cysteine peptidase family C39 domain-containing protein, partial [Myxococcaceae bacterium]
PSIGRNDPSIGRNDPSIGRNDPSIGRNDPSIGRKDPSIGRNDPSIGRNDPSIGGIDWMGRLGPDTTAEEKARDAANSLLENPSFLNPGQPQRPLFVGPSNFGFAQSTVNALPLTDSQKQTLLNAALNSQDVGHRMDVVLRASKGMAPEPRAALLGLVAEKPAGNAGKLVEHIAESRTWQTLSVTEREQLVNVLQVGDERALRLIARLTEAKPAALRAVDREGGTLLGNLARIASQPMNAALYSQGLSRERLVQHVLRDVINPEHIDQGGAPTCTVTSMQYELARDHAAEYSRLVAGLTGPAGYAAMTGGGSLNLQADYVLPGEGDGRSTSEVLFQSAAMEFANGSDNFVEKHGFSARTDGSQYRGLFPSQQKVMLEQLFGTKYKTSKMSTPKQVNTVLERLRPYETSGVNRPVLLEIDEGSFNHVVTYEKMQGGMVYIRDPYGHESSMTEEAFRRHVITVHMPDTLR